MTLAKNINNKLTRVALTVAIFLLAMFVMGFVADPVINLYIDPVDTLSTGSFTEPLLDVDEAPWFTHFIKGLASLGLLGFVKVVLAFGPWQAWNMRNVVGGGGRGRQNTGRDRISNTFWLVVLVGVGTFLWAVYKGVRIWSRRTLEMASDKVMDVPLEDDEDDEYEVPPGTAPS